MEQPLFLAIDNEMPDVISKLVDAGAEINSINTRGHEAIDDYKKHHSRYHQGGTLLDAIESKICSIGIACDARLILPEPPSLEHDETYYGNALPGTYERWCLSKEIEVAHNIVNEWQEYNTTKMAEEEDRPSKLRRIDALRLLKRNFKDLKDDLLRKVCFPMFSLPCGSVHRYINPFDRLSSMAAAHNADALKI